MHVVVDISWRFSLTFERMLQRWMHIRNLPGLEYKTFVSISGTAGKGSFTDGQAANQKRSATLV